MDKYGQNYPIFNQQCPSPVFSYTNIPHNGQMGMHDASILMYHTRLYQQFVEYWRHQINYSPYNMPMINRTTASYMYEGCPINIHPTLDISKTDDANINPTGPAFGQCQSLATSYLQNSFLSTDTVSPNGNLFQNQFDILRTKNVSPELPSPLKNSQSINPNVSTGRSTPNSVNIPIDNNTYSDVSSDECFPENTEPTQGKKSKKRIRKKKTHISSPLSILEFKQPQSPIPTLSLQKSSLFTSTQNTESIKKEINLKSISQNCGREEVLDCEGAIGFQNQKAAKRLKIDFDDCSYKQDGRWKNKIGSNLIEKCILKNNICINRLDSTLKRSVSVDRILQSIERPACDEKSNKNIPNNIVEDGNFPESPIPSRMWNPNLLKAFSRMVCASGAYEESLIADPFMKEDVHRLMKEFLNSWRTLAAVYAKFELEISGKNNPCSLRPMYKHAVKLIKQCGASKENLTMLPKSLKQFLHRKVGDEIRSLDENERVSLMCFDELFNNTLENDVNKQDSQQSSSSQPPESPESCITPKFDNNLESNVKSKVTLVIKSEDDVKFDVSGQLLVCKVELVDSNDLVVDVPIKEEDVSTNINSLMGESEADPKSVKFNTENVEEKPRFIVGENLMKNEKPELTVENLFTSQ